MPARRKAKAKKKAAAPAEAEEEAVVSEPEQASSEEDDAPKPKRKGAKRRAAAAAKKGGKKGRAGGAEGDSIYDDVEGDAEAAEEEMRERPRAAPQSPSKRKAQQQQQQSPAKKHKQKKKGARDALDDVARDVAKPAQSDASDAEPPRSRRAAKKTKPPKKKKAADDGDDDDESDASEAEPSLLSRVAHGRDATVAREWGRRYADEPVRAVVELINLVVEACGCPERVTPEQFEAGDVDQVLRALISPAWTDAQSAGAAAAATEEAAAAECLLTSKRHGRKFRERFLGFWDRVVGVAKEAFLYDGFLLSVLTSWITALSSSSARAFRLTATVTGLQLGRALIDVLRELLELRDKAGRQQRSERRKSAAAAASPSKGKLARIEGQAADLEERIEKLSDAIEEIHRSIVVVRYRDAFPEIRVECVAALAHFISAWPERMLADAYLKYVAWLLNDKDKDVRLAALRGLQDIYATAGDDAPRILERFTERFKPRIVQMVLDVSPAVAVEAVALCRTLAGVMQALEEADLTRIYGLVSHESAEIRHAAGAFAQAVAFPSVDAEHSAATQHAADADADSQPQSQTTQLPEQRESLAEARLRAVIEMAMSYSALPQMPCYVVDALWKVSPTLREWRAMAQMLLRDGASGESDLTDREQALLAGILSSACRMAAGIPITPVPASVPAVTGKELERQRAMQSEMTAEIARLLPRLLEKYRGDADVAAELTEIVPALSLQAFAALRLEKHMTDLLEQLAQLFARHSSDAVLRPCSIALGHLVSRSEPHKQSGEAENAVRTLAERICAALDADDSEEGREAGIRRLQRLSERVDVSAAVDVAKYAEPILQDAAKGDRPASPMTPAAIALLYQRLLWETGAVDVKAGPTEAQIATISSHRDALVVDLTDVVVHHGLEDRPVADAAFVALLDIATLFPPHLAETSLRRLAMQLGNEALEALRKHFSATVLAPATSDKAEDADEEEEGGEDDHRKQEEPQWERLALCYAKAGLAGALPKDHLAAVLCMYHLGRGASKAQQKRDELARTVLRRMRDADRRGEWEAVSLALQRCYEDSEESVAHLAEVSKWISLSYGPAPSGELRQSMFQVVQECVLWALEASDASHIGLLAQSGLLPIANKLGAAEAKLISRLMEQRRDAVGLQLSPDEEDHAPYFEFKAAMDAASKGEKSKTPGTARSSSAKRRKAKSRSVKKISKLDLSRVDEDEDGDEEAAAMAESTPKKRKPSTAVAEEEEEEEEEEPEPLRRSPRKSPQKPPSYVEPASVAADDDDEDDEDASGSKRKRTPANKKKAATPSKTPAKKKAKQDGEMEASPAKAKKTPKRKRK